MNNNSLHWYLRMAPKQWIKLVVYTLLLVNFGHYLLNDLEQTRHTYHSGWQWHDWTASFATSLDELAWFLLLFLLELETYLLSDDAFTRARVMWMNILRVVCYLAIAHTVIAFSDYLVDLMRAPHYTGTTLCEFANQGLSFTRNLVYWELDARNCASLSADTQFYIFSQGQAISDAVGMQIEMELAWADVIEVIAWLLILLMIELQIKLQDRGFSNGAMLFWARNVKRLFYVLLWLIAAYWAYRGHWIFTWDEAMWILGFMAIGMNLSDWRQEIVETQIARSP
jgi:hypothetical protein